MSTTIIEAVASGMAELGLNYHFEEWKGGTVETFFTGEYQERPPQAEDGLQEATFILNGFTRGTLFDLEEIKEKIEQYFNPICGKVTIADNGNVVVIFYENSLGVPTGDAELKRLQINLLAKEWKVNL